LVKIVGVTTQRTSVLAGAFNSAIEALSNLELSETAVALGRIRKDLEDKDDYESAAVADLVRDRVADLGSSMTRRNGITCARGMRSRSSSTSRL
jgi:hypothetical protein